MSTKGIIPALLFDLYENFSINLEIYRDKEVKNMWISSQNYIKGGSSNRWFIRCSSCCPNDSR